ncbi:protein kinase domain-containing protein [Leptolyngbya sp. AN02str]|uniref:serine/threonine protein kinase n=1 Tax=Leptolyngbya sp. AN02str TaxID=3423363 RepID=UPI003D314B8A
MMSRYRINKELGHNHSGGRVTFLATDTVTDQPVVIKQFQFARSANSWVDFDAHQRELQLLQTLEHSGIPRYLTSFETEDGFCLVQEYKDALPLSSSRTFSAEEIRNVAVSALHILNYLQNRIPPVIHRDVKPDNILLDANGNVFLVDFGFAHVGEGSVGVSSVVKGTLGFMPPEQLFHRQLTEASDLYGLGMTLICLLTGTPADQIGDLVDISYRVSFKHLVPKLSIHWVRWLEKMVEPRLSERFPNAASALTAMPSAPLCPPQATLSQSKLSFQATLPAQSLSKAITISNSIPNTNLQGRWELLPHPHDPSPDVYQWISVFPATFESNLISCQIAVNTHYLIPGKTYFRTLKLHTNSLSPSLSLEVSVETAPQKHGSIPVPNLALSLLWGFLVCLAWFVAAITIMLNQLAGAVGSATLGISIGCAVGLEVTSWVLRSAGWRLGAIASTLLAAIFALSIVILSLTGFIHGGPLVPLAAAIGVIFGAIAAAAIGLALQLLPLSPSKLPAIPLTLFTVVFAASFGLSLATQFQFHLISGILSLSVLPLIGISVRSILLSANSYISFQKQHRHLIQP